ncbi:MAG: hypothetical protein RLZZ618_3573 [Pseudomonadota bacterium]|jgi:hypothetical protein
MQTNKQRRRLDVNMWREVFERFDSGELSVARFCQHEGLCVSSFHRWRSRVGAVTVTAPKPQLSPIKASRPQPSAGFVELGALSQSAAAPGLNIRLDLGNGVTLHIVRH